MQRERESGEEGAGMLMNVVYVATGEKLYTLEHRTKSHLRSPTTVRDRQAGKVNTGDHKGTLRNTKISAVVSTENNR